MSATVDERLYQLLPAVYRLRDAQQGEPLRVLMAVMQQELGLIQADIANLYESWFIETCPEWVVPYIGDLLGVRGLFPVDDNQLSLRPYVGNTIGYRRKKGTASMLEGLARDATGGWAAAAVEYFTLLGTTQNLNHIRSVDLRTPDLRDTNALELLGGPFETAMRFADVRRIAVGRGRYNLPNVGIFLWRLLDLPENGALAVADAGGATNLRFDQLGLDVPLFGKWPAGGVVNRRVAEPDMPGPLRLRALSDELDAVRAALQTGDDPPYRYFAPGSEVFLVEYYDATQTPAWVAVPVERIQICDLSTWRVPTPVQFTPHGASTPTVCQLSVDPRNGRMMFLDSAKTATRVWYQHGLASTIGGGGYAPRAAAAAPIALPATVVQITPVTPPIAVDAGLDKAIATWAGNGDVTFELEDSSTYSLGDFSVPAGVRVAIRAKDGQRPTLRLSSQLHVTMADAALLLFDGLLLAGGGIELEPTQVKPVANHTLAFTHCTLVPGQTLDATGKPTTAAGLEAVSLSIAQTSDAAGTVALSFDFCISGRLALAGAPTVELIVNDSIIDGTGGATPAIAGADETQLLRTTVLGPLMTRTLWASDSILDGLITCLRTQVGCLRFSYVGRDDVSQPPIDSITPRRYRCQPDLAIAQLADPAREIDVRLQLHPQFVSTTFGQPHYCQLAQSCDVAIRTGASDGSEMGVYAGVHQPQRLSNLTTALNEYLRLGLEAGVFFVT